MLKKMLALLLLLAAASVFALGCGDKDPVEEVKEGAEAVEEAAEEAAE